MRTLSCPAHTHALPPTVTGLLEKPRMGYFGFKELLPREVSVPASSQIVQACVVVDGLLLGHTRSPSMRGCYRVSVETFSKHQEKLGDSVPWSGAALQGLWGFLLNVCQSLSFTALLCWNVTWMSLWRGCRAEVLLFPELVLLVNGGGRLAADGWKYVHEILHFQPLYIGLVMESGICCGVIAKILKSHMYPNCCL